MKDGLLELLLKSEEYISGQEIADRLKISRNAVWKAVEKIRREGYNIEAVTGKGYRLISADDAFGINSIRESLSTEWLGHELVYYDEIDSTNNEAKRRADKGAAEGLLIVADSQTGGKGRRGRVWQTPPGTNIAMSFLLRPDFSPDMAPMLTLVMAMATAEGIQDVTGTEAGIKWPNDIVLNGRKVVGILTEMTAEPDYIHDVIIGTGINVNTKEFPLEIRATATSLFIETGHIWPRAEITGAVINAFEKYYEIFRKTDSLAGLSKEYNKKCVNTGKRVRVLDPKGEYEADAHGINGTGELAVKKDDGSLVNVYAGEVSVRGIYGYI